MIRKGNFVETYTGKHFWPLDPHLEDVDITDIAHSLSMLCRFNGHTKYFYSVARHSLWCSWLAETARMQLLCLLHDAAEAYLSDVPRPLKYSLPEYFQWEQQVQSVIWKGLQIDSPSEEEQAIIKEIDHTMLLVEAKQLMHFQGWEIQDKPDLPKIDLGEIIITPESVRNMFKRRYKELWKLGRRKEDD